MRPTRRHILLVLIGAPGSGKSTWARRYFHRDKIVSLDRVRGLISGDESNQDCTREAVAIADRLIQGRLAYKQDTVFDATNADAQQRHDLWNWACMFDAQVGHVVFDTPLEMCLARNAKRRGSRRVPTDFVRRTHAQIAADYPVSTARHARDATFGMWIRPDGSYVSNWYWAGKYADEPWMATATRDERGFLRESGWECAA